MKYLGVFEDELPGLVDGAMQSGVFIQKLSSPIYDRYELWHLGWLLKERKLRRIYDDKHGLITCFHSSTRDDWISATTLFSKYSPNRSFTKVCGTLQEAIDLVLENFFRHTVYAEIRLIRLSIGNPVSTTTKPFSITELEAAITQATYGTQVRSMQQMPLVNQSSREKE